MRLLDTRGRERHVFVPGETLTLALAVRAPEPVTDFVFGLGLFTADGVSVYGTNTHLEDHTPEQVPGEGEVRIVLEDLRLVEGTYLVDVAAHRRDGTPYDYHRGVALLPDEEPPQGRRGLSPAPPLRVLRGGVARALRNLGPRWTSPRPSREAGP